MTTKSALMALNLAVVFLGLALVPAIAGATSWPSSGEPLTEDQVMELALSSNSYMGVVRVWAVGDTLDEYGLPIEFMDVIPLRWYEGPPNHDRLRVYADPTATEGLALIRSWVEMKSHGVIIVAFMKNGRLVLAQSPWTPLGGLAEATLGNLGYMDSAVRRGRNLQTLASLSTRASTVALGIITKVVECHPNDIVSFCATVEISATLAGPLLPKVIEIIDPFVGQSDTTTRLLFMHGRDAGGYGLVGFHKGRSRITEGRLPAFENIGLPEAHTVIRRAWASGGRRDLK